MDDPTDKDEKITPLEDALIGYKEQIKIYAFNLDKITGKLLPVLDTMQESSAEKLANENEVSKNAIEILQSLNQQLSSLNARLERLTGALLV